MCGEQLVFDGDMAGSDGSPPRVRGTVLPRLFLPEQFGSPPRVRGTVSPGANTTNALGITPACAGNSVRSQLWPYAHEDHPRVCGEQLLAEINFKPLWGSPPRVRGTGISILGRNTTTRITPACAGNRFSCHAQLHKYWDHPRVCGEQNKRPKILTDDEGSPPRVRGTAVFS